MSERKPAKEAAVLPWLGEHHAAPGKPQCFRRSSQRKERLAGSSSPRRRCRKRRGGSALSERSRHARGDSPPSLSHPRRHTQLQTVGGGRAWHCHLPRRVCGLVVGGRELWCWCGGGGSGGGKLTPAKASAPRVLVPGELTSPLAPWRWDGGVWALGEVVWELKGLRGSILGLLMGLGSCWTVGASWGGCAGGFGCEGGGGRVHLLLHRNDRLPSIPFEPRPYAPPNLLRLRPIDPDIHSDLQPPASAMKGPSRKRHLPDGDRARGGSISTKMRIRMAVFGMCDGHMERATSDTVLLRYSSRDYRLVCA